ncbi:hypothetical protein FLAG1_00257 [Fusarium langsethiae]|uniref:Uncharacterized protein n=1 Tax=Fusarium langsethiae TaxID=179993 RepID=A0A0N0V8P0_FUSLA|nr:hypothetical protein FLAG1_00257 [Fusarium langsethiae]GKU00475.1 unnamed protein product [Fusarium langsethiae]GKU12984.1 unnamed protein product [Fusarium langsethiae]
MSRNPLAVFRCRSESHLPISEEVKSLMHHIATLGKTKQDTYYRFPPPPPFVRWITASPNRNERFNRFLRYGRDGTPVTFRYPTDDNFWGRTEQALRQEAPGMLIYRQLNKPWAPRFNTLPIEGVKFDSFRRLGFAFWDMWRMHLLEASCPLINLDHENDLSGDDSDVFGNLDKTSRATFSATVIVGKTAYPVNDRFGTTSYPKAMTTHYPTNTFINQEDGESYCFDKQSGYVESTQEDTRCIAKSFCDSSYTLDPDNDLGQKMALENDGYSHCINQIGARSKGVRRQRAISFL